MTLKRVLVFVGILLFGGTWVATIVASGAGWNPFQENWDFTNTGAFGDSFGPLSAAMAAVAATAALLAWQSQVAETERAKSNENIARQEAIATRDEATLFQLIGLLRQVISAIDIHLQSGKVKKGHDAIAHIVSRVAGGGKDDIRTSYRQTFSNYRNDLAHYLRLSYNIFSFIESSSLSDKYFYTRIIRAILSDSELALIALNCAYGQGREKYKPLVGKYCLLNNLSDDLVVHFKLVDEFESSAFKKA